MTKGIGFVVDCKNCKKVQAAAIARDDSNEEIRAALRSLFDARKRNSSEPRRLLPAEEFPSIEDWCNCKGRQK